MMRFFLVAVLLAGANAAADKQIHRCLLDDGTYAFQELPCAEPDSGSENDSVGAGDSGSDEASAVSLDEPDFVNPFDVPQDQSDDAEPSLPESISRDRATCEKTTRDAIDAIDLDMRQKPYTKEQGRIFLKELRVLTQQLRACKQL